MDTLLYGKGIIKAFGTGDEKRNVLNGVSVEIKNGEFVSVMGPSGSGKSTLLYALSGMDSIEAGEVIFENRNLSLLSDQELSALRRNRMGFVFQQPTLLKNLNILDNIILPLSRDRHRDMKRLTEKARVLMCRMGIGDLEQRDITRASGGQLQRAGICHALMSDPRIIFGDEPTGALNTKATVMEFLTQINEQGTALLLVTHDPNIAARTERVLFLCDGEIVNECRLSKFTGSNLSQRADEVMRRMRNMEI